MGIERIIVFKFTPPTSKENPAGVGRLLYRYLTPQGISVAKIDGEYYDVRYATTEEIESFDVFYEGGYTHTVSNEEAAELQAAGYSVTPL